jgi:membrane associated rhomboid family serine protease
MDDFLNSLGRLFTDAPYYYLSWPAVAMVVGTLVTVVSASTATKLAITPRTVAGLVGIVTAPFVHANLAHLLANLPPFVVLGYLILRHGTAEFLQAAWMIALGQGVLLWVCGRRAAHMGMSGVIFGFFGWLVGLAYFTRATTDWLVAGGVLLFYGGMLAGVAPARDGTSWEGHLFGLIAGVGAVWLTYGM